MDQNKNILKLDKISKKDKSALPKSTSDTLLLLQSGQNSDEIRILEQIGLSRHIADVKKVEKDLQRFNVYESRFNRKAYSGKQIKEYCVQNGYKSIRVDKFKYEVPIEVGKALLQFREENRESHERSEGNVILRDKINLQPSNFFLLISIQASYGAKIKSATLLYREDYKHDSFERMDEDDMVVEVFSWGVKGEEPSLISSYLKYSDSGVWIIYLLLIIAGICATISDTAGIILVLMIISIIAFLTTFDNKFFKWN